MTAREFVTRAERAAAVLRRIIGVPDYDIYLEHLRKHHPDAKPMSRDEFLTLRVAERYSKPGARCC